MISQDQYLNIIRWTGWTCASGLFITAYALGRVLIG